MIDRDHPAVETVHQAQLDADNAAADAQSMPRFDHPATERVTAVIRALLGHDVRPSVGYSATITALEHITHDPDATKYLRDTPAGRALMAEALEDEACRMDVVISNGDAAEQAAPAPGETGRGGAVTARDALYENPAQYLRKRADAYRTETPDE